MKRRSRKFVLQNTSIGALFGAFMGGFFVWMLGADLSENLTKFGTYAISATVTLLASSLALAGVLANIENQNEKLKEARLASLAAAKSTLPLAITELNGIALFGAQVCLKHQIGPSLLNDSAEIEPLSAIEKLTLSKDSITILKQNIEFASESDREHLSKLVRTYQVLHSRLDTWIRTSPSMLILDMEAAIDWAVYFRQIENVYEYAREETNEIPNELQPLRLRQFFLVKLRVTGTVLDALEPLIDTREQSDNPMMF